MIAYVDSSVLLRVALGEKGRFVAWKSIDEGVVSALVEVECARTLDRLRLTARLSDRDLAIRRAAVYRLLETMQVVELDRGVLARASQPFATALGTLDAIHLATALLWREQTDGEVVMATHDLALATAAEASGLRVVGV